MKCLAQQQLESQPTVLRSETAAVTVDVIVTDHKGHHVPGLTVTDFRLFEDSAPQKIASFIPPPTRAQRHEAEGHERPAAEVNGRAPSVSPGQAAPPQLITLVIDIGDLQFEHLKQACTAASRFAKKTIAAGNSVAVYAVDTSLHLAVPFTNDRQRALDVLEKIGNRVPFGRLTASEGALTQASITDLLTSIHPVPESATGKGQRNTPERMMQKEINREALQDMKMAQSWLVIASSFQARAIFMALRALALGYRALPGRKSVVVFSGGFPHSKLAEAELQAVIDAANRANVAIYVIDASGLNSGRSGALVGAQMQRPDITDGSRAVQNIGDLRDKDSQAGGISRHEWAQTMGSPLYGDLGLVADRTGGFLVKDTNDPAPALDRVEQDASEFYTLVYYPLNHTYDGAFRAIKVELSERGYKMRYRQGYWALPPGRDVMMTPAAAQLLAAVESGERKPSFAPQVNAVAVPAPDGRFGIAAAVSMPGKLVRFEKLKDQRIAGVSLLLIARDEKGQLLSIQERYADVRLKPEDHAAFSTKIFNLQGHVPIPELAPVSVQAIVRFADGTLGISERENLRTVPASSKLRLTNLLLSDHQEDSECPTDPMNPLCVKGVRISMPAQPQFARATPMLIYFGMLGLEVGDNQRPAFSVSFRLGFGDAFKSVKAEKLSITAGGTPNSFLALGSFDLRALQPGKYTLEMTAEDKIQHAQAKETTAFLIQ
jgi:VWFA-related protein